MDKYIEKFNTRFEKSSSGCWIWLRGIDGKGYGQFTANGKKYRAHRWIWAYYNGPIPEGMQILHSCDVPRCVNPAHLTMGTHQDNMRDRNKKGRQARGERSGVNTQPHTRCYGERSAKAKLNWETVDAIRADKELLSNRAIARKYKLSCGQVNKILNNVQWKEEHRYIGKGVYGE